MKKHNIQIGRLLACIMVFLVHYADRMFMQGTAAEILAYGGTGVCLFYIISGYLIANSYERYGSQDRLGYIVNRLIKLLPLYYCVIVYYFVMHTFILRDVPEDPAGLGWARYFLLLNGIVPKTGLYFWDNLGITWSVPCFLFAYVTLPFLLKYIRSFPRAVVCCVLARWFAVRWIYSLGGWLMAAYNMTYFMEGVALYFCLKEGRQKLMAVGLCGLFVYYTIADISDNMQFSCVFLLLLMVSDGLQIKNPVVCRILNLCDRYTYTMYLCHGIVFLHLLDRYYLVGYRSKVAIWGSLALTVFVYHCLETPLQRCAARAWNRLRQSRSQV